MMVISVSVVADSLINPQIPLTNPVVSVLLNRMNANSELTTVLQMLSVLILPKVTSVDVKLDLLTSLQTLKIPLVLFVRDSSTNVLLLDSTTVIEMQSVLIPLNPTNVSVRLGSLTLMNSEILVVIVKRYNKMKDVVLAITIVIRMLVVSRKEIMIILVSVLLDSVTKVLIHSIVPAVYVFLSSPNVIIQLSTTVIPLIELSAQILMKDIFAVADKASWIFLLILPLSLVVFANLLKTNVLSEPTIALEMVVFVRTLQIHTLVAVPSIT